MFTAFKIERNIFRLRVKFFRACLPTGTSLKMHISQLALSAVFFVLFKIEAPNWRYTLYFVFILSDIADLRKVVSIKHLIIFFQKFVMNQKKLIKFFACKLSFVKICPLYVRRK